MNNTISRDKYSLENLTAKCKQKVEIVNLKAEK